MPERDEEKWEPVPLFSGMLWIANHPASDPDAAAIREWFMSVDTATVRRIAHLARIAVKDEDVEKLQGELNGILNWVEMLKEVDTDAVEPMTSVMPMAMKKRQDVVSDGNKVADIVKNAPMSEDNFFVVPKVVE